MVEKIVIVGGGQASIDYAVGTVTSGTLYQGFAGGSGTSDSSTTISTRAGGGGGGAACRLVHVHDPIVIVVRVQEVAD